MQTSKAFNQLYETVIRLRGPGGCAWDREQTPSSLRGDLIEETYECIEAIDDQNPEHIKEELGDIFLLVTMMAYMHEELGIFSVADTLEGISEKLIRRHPHVFAPASKGSTSDGNTAPEAEPALSPEEILKNWAKMKVEQEGRAPKDSILDSVRRGLPPLDRAWNLQKKAAKAGFDWPDTDGVMDKIAEELDEVKAAMAAKPEAAGNSQEDRALEEELGDLLFSVVNLCRFLGIEPSVALQRTNIKFTERFKIVEKKMKESGEEMNAENLEIMEKYWNEAKVKP